ncbi:MAG TPA: heparan-alpha-glucosaminide N-acetyltransferase domain-containing protein [Vicinamibacterales bacterium]|nr:heparan-alpha-glucosaminide N-acetyltransferase domain-containing protein [Vicinamibacterales bacterium]
MIDTKVAPVSRVRIEAIDVLRGLVMILMALDHTRDFFGATAISPTDLGRTTVALFLTRWITHLCAPVFFLLTGTSAYLTLRRRGVPALSRLLVTRGLWLIALELTVLRCFGYQFNVDYRVTMLIVLWALGWSMIALGALVHLPVAAVGAIGVAMIASHNLLDSIRPATLGAFAPLWTILHVPGIVLVTPSHTVFAAYALVPWIGVTAAGFALGAVYRQDSARRRRVLTTLGVALTAAFVLLRTANVYGDPVRWSAQKSAAFSILSWLNTTKYPPSLLFLLMTLGPAMLLLRMLDDRTPPLLAPARVFGKVPMFYFVLHMPLIHALAIVACFARYGTAHWMFESPRLNQYPFTPPPGWGYPLPAVYLAWAAVVALLYPACRWYGAIKERRDRWWTSYL